MSKWGKLELSIPDFESMKLFAEWINDIKKVVETLANLLEVMLTFLSALDDPAVAIIQQVVNTLKEAVESWVEDVGIYGILIPHNKRFYTSFAGLGDVTPPKVTALFPEDQGLNDPNITDGERRFLINANRFNGGNPGFYRQVLDSIHDKGDRNRPQFNSPNDWVGGVVLLLGSNVDPFGFLDDFWALKGLFGDLFESNYITTIPTAKNLKAEALSRPGSNGGSGGKMTVLLKWDSLDVPFVRLPDLGNTVLVPERQAIIMVKNDIQATTAMNVVQLMGTRELTEGLKSGNAKVIYEEDFSIIKNSHRYEIDDVDMDDSYYFAIAYKNKVWRTDEDWRVDPGYALGYWDTSNIAGVTPYPVLPGSTPPDWVRSWSMGELFPDLGYFLRRMVGFIDDLANRLLGLDKQYQQYIDFLRAEAARYEALVQEILTRILKLAELLKIPGATGGVYIRKFEGQGGNQYFLSDLAKSLSDSFETSPPFHRGDEYVMGVVLMTGGSKTLVEPALFLFDLAFGLQSDGDDLMDSLGDAVTQLEAQCFGDDLQIIPCTEEEAFSESIEPLVKCTPEDPPEYEFGEDMNPTV